MCLAPLVSYSNIDTLKLSILNDNKLKAGIYRIINNTTGESYVGSSINISQRFKNYFNINYISTGAKSSRICRALLKYGYSNFSLEIIEYCDVSVLLERETFYIQTLKPEYNILQSGGSNLGYKHTEETKAKMSGSASNRTDELKAKYSKAAVGRKFNHTEETKAKLSAASLDRRLSEETRAKLSVIQSNRLKHPVPGMKVEVTDTLTGETFLYDSIRMAARELNTNHNTIRNYIKSKKLFQGKFQISVLLQ